MNRDYVREKKRDKLCLYYWWFKNRKENAKKRNNVEKKIIERVVNYIQGVLGKYCPKKG